MIRLRLSTLAVLAVLVGPGDTWAQAATPQGAAPQVFTLEEALQYALDHYPTDKAAIEQVNATSAGVSVARAAYLPRLDSLWQSNRGTANNIFGQVLPQSVIPAISGPVLPSASGQSVWGSAAGALFSWEPFDFGLRGATVRGAEAAVVLQPDTYWAGGISELAKICAIASTYDLPVIPHGHSVPANVHLSAALPALSCPMVEFLVKWNVILQFFWKEPLVPVDGYITVPDRPGMGMELDMSKVEEERELDWSDKPMVTASTR